MKSSRPRKRPSRTKNRLKTKRYIWTTYPASRFSPPVVRSLSALYATDWRFSALLCLYSCLCSPFLGPLFYAHGQTEIFYKYNNQNVNYALAKENSAYNGYVVNDSVELDSKVVTAMNSNIKSMIEEGKDYLLVEGETGNFEINRLGDEIYTLSGRNG